MRPLRQWRCGWRATLFEVARPLLFPYPTSWPSLYHARSRLALASARRGWVHTAAANMQRPHAPVVHGHRASRPTRLHVFLSLQTPIIIVPPGTKPILTMYNVKEFLENNHFETNEEVIKRGGTRVKYSALAPWLCRPPFFSSFLPARSSATLVDAVPPLPPVVNIQRKRDGQTVNYRVTDSPAELRPEDWARVVAVFVAGPEWQFRDWPDVRAGQRPVDLFTKCARCLRCCCCCCWSPGAQRWLPLAHSPSAFPPMALQTRRFTCAGMARSLTRMLKTGTAPCWR